MGRWWRHRSGGVGLRSERPGITRAMGPSMSWDPWSRPVARAAVGMQECTQISENGLSAPFRGICVHCCAIAGRRGGAGVYTDRRKWPFGATTARIQNAPFGEAHTQNAPFREGDTPRVRLYVSRRLQSGAFVYTVATRFAEAAAPLAQSLFSRPSERGQRGGAAGTPWWLRRSCHLTQLASQFVSRLASQQCTQVPRNGAERPFPPICVHSCVVTLAVRPTSPGQ